MQDFFQPALENIRLNAGDSAVSDEHMQTVCRQILEEVTAFFLCLLWRDVMCVLGILNDICKFDVRFINSNLEL